RYFAEERPNEPCNGCDNCLNPPETFDGTIATQKFLSCVLRIQQKSGFAFGLNHIVEVLTGADTEAIRQRGHNELSTYGIGKELKRDAWQALGRELLRLELVEVAPGKFATLQVTEAGRESLRNRTAITLTKQPDKPEKRAKQRAGAIECDEALFDDLRLVRRNLADERNVPAYVVFSDVALREMARSYPTTPAEFRRIPGVGEQKLKDFAEPFLSAIESYLSGHARQDFAAAASPVARRPLNDSEAETLRRFQVGESVEEIARTRGFVRGTILGHLVLAAESGTRLTRAQFFTPVQAEEISGAFTRSGAGNLTGIRDDLGGKYEVSELRLFRALKV
ncbi:MAG: RQC domain-containing protein, partial [Chthoniobacterales bacterium]